MANTKFKPLKFGMGSLKRHTGKGASEQMLPARGALNTLTKGDPGRRTLNDYAKMTPGPDDESPDMNEMSSSLPIG